MDKIITISIAAYNAEPYIRETLESLLIGDQMDEIEVFIIDDGGTDGTLDIAKEYKEKYPDTFIPVHKENGGYGSTVNYSIEHASGKYFKLLDGDDWFDTDGFRRYLDILRKEDADVVVTNYRKGYDRYHLEEVVTHSGCNGETADPRSGFDTNEPFDMWALTYKTSLIRESGLKLPEKVLYTDRYFSTIPFAYVNSIRFYSNYVYCYRIGRDGQSMSVDSQLKHYAERVNGSIDLCKFYAEQKAKGNPRCTYLLSRVTASHLAAASVHLLMKKSKESRNKLKNYEKTIKGISLDILYKEKHIGKVGWFMTLCRRSNYLVYWLTPDFVMKMV